MPGIFAIARPLVLALVALVACTKSSPSNEADASSGVSSQARTWSCDRASSVGTCSEYGREYVSQNEVLVKSSCARLGGALVEADCPNTSVVGACTLSSGEIRKYYGTGSSAYDVDRARTECATTFHGAWR